MASSATHFFFLPRHKLLQKTGLTKAATWESEQEIGSPINIFPPALAQIRSSSYLGKRIAFSRRKKSLHTKYLRHGCLLTRASPSAIFHSRSSLRAPARVCQQHAPSSKREGGGRNTPQRHVRQSQTGNMELFTTTGPSSSSAAACPLRRVPARATHGDRIRGTAEEEYCPTPRPAVNSTMHPRFH